MVPLAFGQLDAGDAYGRVVLAHARDGGTQEPTDRFEPMALRGRLAERGEHFYDVLLAQCGDALVPVRGAEALDDPAPRLLRVGCKLRPIIGLVVADDKGVDGAGV